MHFSFAEIIHPTSQERHINMLISMIIAQMCLRLVTILGRDSEKCLEGPPFSSCSATRLLHIELIKWLIVAVGYGMGHFESTETQR